MTTNKPTMDMPELLVFIKPLIIGFIIAEVWRVAFHLGGNFAVALLASELKGGVTIVGILTGVVICLIYLYERGAHITIQRMARSLRFDMLLAAGVGVWTNALASPLLTPFHSVLDNANPFWAPSILVLLFGVLLSPLIRQYWSRPGSPSPQLYFIDDEEIKNDDEDLLACQSHAQSFAETVLASGAHAGLIFGVDGPWGVGKTSFINLAQQHWEKAEDQAIVCRFEPLRYASEPDLTDRLIHDVSAAIRRKVFAPEFRPAASRYSRLIRGKADFSFLG